jgi:hypothetical protein
LPNVSGLSVQVDLLVASFIFCGAAGKGILKEGGGNWLVPSSSVAVTCVQVCEKTKIL